MDLFVAGLPYDLDDDELMEIFEKFGPTSSAKVAMDKETGKSRGFGFVTMENESDGKDAIEHLTGIVIGKKPLVVKAASDRSEGRSSSPRPSSGGFRSGNSGQGYRGRPDGGNRGGNGWRNR